MQTHKRRLLLAASALGLAFTGLVRAHGNEGHPKKAGPVVKEQKDWGIAGDAKAVRRTIEVRMGDNMRFTPERIEVRQGETLRLRVHNTGKVMHEFVIGTKAENVKHAELMIKHPNMEHDEPYMAHVAPGKTGDIIWTFNRPGTFEFACLIAGHYSAGMVGTIIVTPGARS
ncbi:MAG: cupredoxin domain-containing protein [Rubrivivax sp.]